MHPRNVTVSLSLTLNIESMALTVCRRTEDERGDLTITSFISIMAFAADDGNAVVARLLLPDDANPAGNVHGGTILRLMEEAGMIAARRFLFANKQQTLLPTSVAALVRFENMSFYKPVYVGEVASVSAHVVFTSPHSVCVKVVVTAENLCGGETRITNSGELWYVPLVAGENGDWKNPMVGEAPQLSIPTGGVPLEEYNHAKQSYQSRKHGQTLEEQCLTIPGCPSLESFRSSYVAHENGGTPAESEQELCQMVLPGDCEPRGFAYGGFVMKLMDNAAACSAFRHCRTNVVTVVISAMDFVSWIRLGDVCSIRSKVVFASTKTLQIEVAAFDASIQTVGTADTLVANGMFIFASLDEDGKAIPVPPLKLKTDEDFEKAYLGQLRYVASKKARASKAGVVGLGKRAYSTFSVADEGIRTFSTINENKAVGSFVMPLLARTRRQMAPSPYPQGRPLFRHQSVGGITARCVLNVGLRIIR